MNMASPTPTSPVLPGVRPMAGNRAAKQIFRELRSDIVDGTLSRGSRLPTERALAKRYEVSNPTVREAMRALDLLGFVDVRHGSGTYVSADTAELIATCLASVIRLSELDVKQVLGIFSVLSEHAASCAARSGTQEDHDRLLASLDPIAAAGTTEEAAEAVLEFHAAVAASAHNALLSGLIQFLARVQVELGMSLADGSRDHWRRILAKLATVRRRLVLAIVRRDQEDAEASSRAFSVKALAAITWLPNAREVRRSDPMFRKTLSSMMSRMETD